MAGKKCCVDTCNSCSTRKEDYGVTFHKFPKDVTLHDIWISVTHYSHKMDVPKLVCSRHFCKSDFKTYKSTKYILKSDAVPSIFPWVTETDDDEMESIDETSSTLPIKQLETKEDSIGMNNKEPDNENVDAIRKFIEDQEKEIQELKVLKDIVKEKDATEKCNIEGQFSVSSSAIDNMMINEAELELAKKKDGKNKTLLSSDKGNNSIALSIGSKVEAKDFGEVWHLAQITEVDYDEMEVLVHYETTNKIDEWISVSSPRLRPQSSAATVKPGPSSAESLSDLIPISAIKEEIKEHREDKVKLTYVVGERCLARWRDNRRFIATVSKDLGGDSYEVIFDDGCVWKCKTTRLYKLKPGKLASTEASKSPASFASPVHEAGPSTNAVITPLPVYHTHLFDPTRDYLPSKSERREMKRKLNIKEIFNIGQKKKKTQHRKSPKEKPQRQPAEKKLRTSNSKVKEQEDIKPEIKTEIPAIDAVASIIGTFNSAEPVKRIKMEPVDPEDESTPDNKDYEDASDTAEVVKVSINDFCDIDEDSGDSKMDFDPVTEEEVKLENFEKPDQEKHVEVIDRIKEAINKLEGGLNKLEKDSSPKPKVNKEIVKELKIKIEKVEVDLEDTIKEPEVEQTDVIPTETKEILTMELPDVTSEIKICKDESSAEVKPEETVEAAVASTVLLPAVTEEININNSDKVKTKKLSKVKKTKKLRLLREKKVKKQVEKVKNELEEMRKQMEEMRKQMLEKSQDFKVESNGEMPESFMLPGEWCCKWVNGQPVGTVSEMQCDLKPDPNTGVAPLPRRSVQVEDKRLPAGWTKHMVRRSFGHSAGKWDVVLINPEDRRFHTKNDMRNYLENNPELKHDYEHALLDFGIHLKLARRMGWISRTPDGAPRGPSPALPSGTLSTTSPLVKRKILSLKKKAIREKRPRLTIKIKKPRSHSRRVVHGDHVGDKLDSGVDNVEDIEAPENPPGFPPLEDGYVYCGSLKVQIIETLLRCPAEGCFKNFRNTTLLKMHIKHYHRELRKLMGATPKVLDLAYARSRKPPQTETQRSTNDRIIKVKIPRPPKREEPKPEPKEDKSILQVDTGPTTPVKEPESIPRTQDSPKLRQMLINRPVKRPRVLLPVRRPEEIPVTDSMNEDEVFDDSIPEPSFGIPMEVLDFESAISTHTVTKPVLDKRRKGEKKRKSFALVHPYRPFASEDDDCLGVNSDIDTRSSFPRSGTPDSKIDIKTAPVSSESNEDMNKEANMYTYNENGERIKIVHMKREEIINCHCGIREEDGLMVQCELCLCWQHALCHNIQKEADVPEKYTCSICLNPRRGRRSKRFLHDQDRLYEGLLPGAKPDESLRRSHELSGNLLRIGDCLDALKLKYYVATKKDHPKLYLWAKDWEHAEIQYTQEKLNSDYSDLNIMSSLGKENLPVKPDEVRDLPMDIQTPPSEEHDRYSQREGSQPLLSGLLSSPGGASLDLPISTSELERLAKSVQEQECERATVMAPVPEAPIENSACKKRLLKHIHRCQALIDARLDSIEAQVAELESQDPSLQDDETADHYPRTKQTVQLLLRDLETMEELGVIT